MKTLLYTLEYPPHHGGVASYYGNLLGYWPEGEEILVQVATPQKGYGKYWAYIKELQQIRKEKKVDYIIIGNILPLGTVAYFLSLFSPLKYAVVFHGLDFSWATKTPWKLWLAKIILRRADKIISANHYTASLIKALWYHKYDAKIKVVNPGASKIGETDINLVENLKKQYNIRTDNFVLLSLGRLVKRKGFDKTIAAVKQISQTKKYLHYFLIGAGPEEDSLKALAKGESNITFIGAISEAEKWAWLELSDCFIMPARNIAGDFEGFGIVYLEANLAGKPVISGLAGGVADSVENEVNGLAVNGEQVAEIEAAILRLMADRGLRERLGQDGKLRAQNEFNWEKQSREFYNFIKA